MNQIKSKPVQLGKFYRTTEEAFRGELPVIVYYQDYPAIPGNETDEPEPAKVEIHVVYVCDDVDFVRVEPSDDWIEDMQAEILDSLG
jgi:hypothetical protein